MKIKLYHLYEVKNYGSIINQHKDLHILLVLLTVRGPGIIDASKKLCNECNFNLFFSKSDGNTHDTFSNKLFSMYNYQHLSVQECSQVATEQN